MKDFPTAQYMKIIHAPLLGGGGGGGYLGLVLLGTPARTSSQEALREGYSSGMFNRQPFYQEEQALGAHFL